VESGLPAGPCSLAANTTYTGMLFDCDKLEMRSGTVVRNSVITGEIKGDPDNTAGTAAPFVIEDSTIRGDGCVEAAALGNSNYIARRVEVTGFVDAFRVEHSKSAYTVTIEDSYARTCHVGDSHGDGLQGYKAANRIVFRHNTVDMPGVGGTAPLFWADSSSSGGVFVDNLLAGGSYTMRIQSGGGHTVTGNRVVDKAWEFGPTDCAGGSFATWANNRLVTLGTNYTIAETRAEVRC
jgi:hypothetical protein